MLRATLQRRKIANVTGTPRYLYTGPRSPIRATREHFITESFDYGIYAFFQAGDWGIFTTISIGHKSIRGMRMITYNDRSAASLARRRRRGCFIYVSTSDARDGARAQAKLSPFGLSPRIHRRRGLP